ncbi:MAG: hypothetical protein JF588_19805 [Caulobacterales bacterium]|nr:hypothetical protein [Caulobacterales bacterium]
MRAQLYAFTAAAALLVASPCLALTVQSTPNREQVEHLRQQKQTSGAQLPDSLTSSDRPGWATGANFSSSRGAATPGVTSYNFGNVRTTVMVDPDYARDQQVRRETPAPLSLSPPRR